MDRRKAFFFIGLAVIGALWLVALGAGVRVNSTGGGASPRSLTSVPDWIGSAGSLLGRWAPRLDVSGLTCSDGGAMPVRDIRLAARGDGTRSCTIRVPAARARKDHQRTGLHAEGAGAAPTPGVYVRARYEPGNFPEGQCHSGSPRERPWLEVSYVPADGGSGSESCLVRKPSGETVALTVLEGGGDIRLTLHCQGCPDEAAGARVRLQ